MHPFRPLTPIGAMLGLLAVCLTPGCGKQGQPGTEPATEPGQRLTTETRPDRASPQAASMSPIPATDATENAAGAGAAPERASVAPITAAEVEALVKAWVKAQQDGDFKSYATLYAARFHGVKRVGRRKSTYDRRGWLADRAKMLEGKPAVEVADLKVQVSPGSAVAVFGQTFTLGTFKDQGPKQLVLAREGKDLRIAREEMLASTVKGGPAAGQRLALAQLALLAVTDGKGRLGLVLDPKPSPAWAMGPASTIVRGASARKAVDPAKLPAELRAALERPVFLYGAKGKVCAGKPTGFLLLAEARPHFGTVQQWNAVEGGPREPDATVAEAIFGLAGSRGLRLVAELDVDRAACPGAVFARAAAAPAPAFFTQTPADADLAQRGLAALKALKGYALTQRQFLAEGKTGDWERYDGGKPDFTVLAHPTSGARFLFVRAEAGRGCGDFRGELWAVFAVTGPAGAPALAPLTDPESPGVFFLPAAVVDLDGDGKPELLTDDLLLRHDGRVFRTERNLAPPDFDCPC